MESLKCDADGCDYFEEVGRITADMVGVRCPACGANLLTEEDYRAWQPISKLLTEMNRTKQDGDSKTLVALRVGLRGSKTRIDIDNDPS